MGRTEEKTESGNDQVRKPDLSRRLQAVASLVTPGSTLADIGTDHAYVPAWLVLSEIVPKALAMDVGAGPLERADRTIARYGLSDRIGTRLSDGLQKLMPGEAQSVVIAGMGGALTVRILSDDRVRTLQRLKIQELILQPQSEIALVREFLRTNGWLIDAENMVLEDGKYYPMMRAHRIQKEAEAVDNSRVVDTDRRRLEDLYGPCLLAMKHPVLLQYLTFEHNVFKNIEGQLAGSDGEAAAARRKELAEKIRLNRLADAVWR